MKIDLENMHSPCSQCYIRGKLYSPDDETCQRCEYNIAIYLLRRVLCIYDGCNLCKNEGHLDDTYFHCKISKEDRLCDIDTDFVIDWEKAFKEYGNIK